MILDRFSVEVFINDGEQVMTAIMYTDQAADGISFFADGTVSMDVVKYDLMSQENETSGSDDEKLVSFCPEGMRSVV